MHATERARAMLEALPKSGQAAPHEYSQILEAFAEAGSPEACLDLLRRMRRADIRPTLQCYAYVVSALHKAGRSRDAARWMRRVVQPEVSHRLLSREEAEGEVVGRVQYNKVLASYAAAGRPLEAMATMRQMVSQGGVTPDIFSFNCLISAHAAAGEPERAFSWLTRAAQWGVTPDVVSYTTAISGYARALRPEQAQGAFEAMVRAGVEPNVLSYSSLVDAYAVAGRVEEAHGWLDKASAAGVRPNVVTYSCVAKGYARLGRLEDAERVLQQMDKAGARTLQP